MALHILPKIWKALGNRIDTSSRQLIVRNVEAQHSWHCIPLRQLAHQITRQIELEQFA
jgi:hypothetical protein